MNRRYRLIALDIDGTIRSNDYPLSDRTRRAVARAGESGAIVTLATGRMFRSARTFAAELSITSPIISFQGAHIADPVSGHVLWHRPLTPKMTLSALEALKTWEGVVLARHGDRIYTNMLTPWVEAYGERNEESVHVVEDLRPLASKRLTRLAVVGDEDELDGLLPRLKAGLDSQLYVTRSLPHLCEILHPQAGKHNGLAWLRGHLVIPAEQSIAIANGIEDVQMLRDAGLGVAVEGGVPEALAAADVVAAPVEEDGPAKLIEELLDKGLIG